MKLTKLILTGSALALGLTWTATPARAQMACDINGVPQVPPPGSHTLTCGSTVGAILEPNNTTVGVQTVAGFPGGSSATAIGANAVSDPAAIGGSVGPTGLLTYIIPAINGSTAVGAYAYAVGLGSVAVGDQAGVGVLTVISPNFIDFQAAPGGTAIGSHSLVTGNNGTAVGYNSDATGANSVAIGANSVASQANTVSVGATGAERRIVNVAAGTAATDAVNVSQLASVTTNVTGLQTQTVANTTAITSIQTVNTTQATQISALQSDVGDLDTRVSALEGLALDFNEDLDRVDRRAAAGTATAIALSGAVFLPGKTFNLTGNVGAYRGAVAGALQIGMLVSANMALNAGVAKGFNRGGKTGVRAGFTLGW